MEDKDQSNDVTRTETKTVHERFEVLIKALGLTRNKFAAKLGMASTQIYSVINGRNAPSHKMYAAIASKIPEANLNYLIAGIGDPVNPLVKVDSAKEASKVKKLEKELELIRAQLEARSTITSELVAKEVAKIMQAGVTHSKQKNSHHIDGISSKRKKIKVKRK